MDILNIIGRKSNLFDDDISSHNEEMTELVNGGRFLIIGGAGSIGQAVTKEIFKRHPRALHIVDISENNIAELVRDIRSTLGYIDGDFRTFTIDCGSLEFLTLVNSVPRYDYILNLSALKHVRSERDPFTLMRLIEVNILNTLKIGEIAKAHQAKKYFCVSTDKAANPVNMMGASKRIMELFLGRESANQTISTARFANVAFSDGSLLHSFTNRFLKQKPISGPSDVKRYFVTPKESGELCLMSCLLGSNQDIFFPKLNNSLHLLGFPEIAERYLANQGYEAYHCDTEEEARLRCQELIAAKRWPCYFSSSNTTGEKGFEEFYTSSEKLDMAKFQSVGIVKQSLIYNSEQLDYFQNKIQHARQLQSWDKKFLLELFQFMLPDFVHRETNLYLDGKM